MASQTKVNAENAAEARQAGMDGNGQMQRMVNAMDEIVEAIGKVTSLVEEIATASNEQAHGITQVNNGLGQIDNVTQRNTANAEESAAASEELSGQAAGVLNLLSRFMINSQDFLSQDQLAITHNERSHDKKRPFQTTGRVFIHRKRSRIE